MPASWSAITTATRSPTSALRKGPVAGLRPTRRGAALRRQGCAERRTLHGDGCCFPRRRATMPIQQKNATLDEVVEIMGGEVRKAVDQYFNFLQKAVSSYPLGDTELGGKAKDCAEKNITMARDYMHKLSRAKNPPKCQFIPNSCNLNWGSLASKLKVLARFIPKRRQRCSTLL